MNNGPNLWWIYDESEARFSSLPTGPLLLPGIILTCLAWLIRGLFGRKIVTLEDLARDPSKSPEWRQKHARYTYLLKRWSKDGGYDNFTWREMYEMDELEDYLFTK